MKTYKELLSESPFTKPRKQNIPKMDFKNGVERVFGLVVGRQTIVRIFKTNQGIPKGFLQWGTKEIRLDDLKVRITTDQLLKMKKSEITNLVNQAIDDKLI